MLRTDTGNFNKLLASLGLLALAAAFLVPYFYFRDTDVLRISKHELRGLTPSAQGSLETRQHRIGDLELPVAGISILLGGAGIALLLVGGRRLRTAQDKEDAALDRRAQREDYEIEQLSRDEVERKRDEQAQEAAEVESDDAEEVGARVGAGIGKSTATPEPENDDGSKAAPGSKESRPSLTGEGPSAEDEPEWVAIDEDGLRVPPTPLVSSGQARIEIARVEEAVRDALEGIDFEHFAFKAGVKIIPDTDRPRHLDAKSRQVEVDGLFEAKGRRPDVAMELKVTRLNVRSLKRRTRIFTDSTLALLTRYNHVTGREVLGWLLIVVPQGAIRLSGQERKNVEDHFERALAGRGKCSVMHEEELEWVPSAFEALFD